MARRRAARARRRVAERARANALALEAAAEGAEERPKLKRARHVEQLAFLEGRGAITERQRAAGERLRRDFFMAGDMPRVTLLYEPRTARPPRQFLFNGDDSDPVRLDARKRFEKAIRPLGPRLVPVTVHVAVLDLALGDWSQPGVRNGDGAALLRLALDVLGDHYRLAECDAVEAPRTGAGDADGAGGMPQPPPSRSARRHDGPRAA